MRLLRTILAATLAAVVSMSAQGQDWTNWRGPHYNGSADAKNLPVEFSTTKNVKWSAPMPGPSAATPIVLGDRVFTSSIDKQKQDLLAICLDRKTGKVLWQHSAHSGYITPGGTKVQFDDRSNYASPSPVTDGKRIVFFFGNGDLVSYDLDGNKQWARNIQKDYGDFAFMWTFSSSPLLYQGKLYLQILQRDTPVTGRGRGTPESYLLAMDPATGKELWKHVRPTPAIVESREAYSTPIPYEGSGRKEILIAGGNILSGHDPETGEELWRWGTWNPSHREQYWRLVASPVAGNGVVLACAPKGFPVYAAKAGGKGDLGDAGLAWKSENRGPVTSDVATPVFYQGKFFVVSDIRKAISCVNPADGAVEWTTPLQGPAVCWGSPTGADGKIYVLSVRGEVFVLEASSGKILSSALMAEGEGDIRSTIAVAHGNLFIRTESKLFCIGN
jgi:outer membrane protein assembly factor BamB